MVLGMNRPFIFQEGPSKKQLGWKFSRDKNLQSVLSMNGVNFDEYGFSYRGENLGDTNTSVFFWGKYAGNMYKVRILRFSPRAGQTARSMTKIDKLENILKEFQ